MIDTAKRFAAAAMMSACRVPQRNRNKLYRGEFGLRIVTFHDVPSRQFDSFRRLVDECIEMFDVVGPEIVSDLMNGRMGKLSHDKLLFTFDDGFISNYKAAEYLAKQRVKAIFFVVTSFLERTMEEYLDFHSSQGVQAYRFQSVGEPRGLSRSQVREMTRMGHLIGGHNFAHRDLGKLTTQEDLKYEVDRAVDSIAELTGAPCEHFAFGFGHPRHLSDPAYQHVRRRCPFVYACVRGLNVTGTTPRLLLRDGISLEHPLIFNRLCLRGGMDLRWAGEVLQLKQIAGAIPVPNAAI